MMPTNPALVTGVSPSPSALFTLRSFWPGLDGCWQRISKAMANASSESELPHYHETVLLHETVDAVTPSQGLTIVDATLGGGGHTEALLQRGHKVIAIDQDTDALAYARKRLQAFSDQVVFCEGNFSQIKELLTEKGIDQVDGIIADLGVSSHQFDEAERGFSFSKDGPLDMRMGSFARCTAADIVNQWEEKDLADMIYKYGDERASRRIARAIVERRAKKPFDSTVELAELIQSTIGRRGKTHPATKTFQAIRIAVNQELEVLEGLLEQSVSVLKSGGRLGIITFHSLEDRIVKHFIREQSQKEIDRPEWPAPRPNPDHHFTQVQRKPIEPSAAEINRNPRSRSAKLRVAERI